MKDNSTSIFIDPEPTDWLNSDRLRYLYDCILPLTPLLLEAKLLDQVILAWLQSEIIYEIKSTNDSKDDKQELLLIWSRQQWGHRLESLYLSSKAKLDLVSYRILTVETASLAHELYYRLKANEASFDELCVLYSVGKERFNGGKFLGVPLNDFPLALQSVFSSMQAGDLHKPIKYGTNFAVLQLLKFEPASLNSDNESRLLLLQFTDWQQVMITAVRRHLLLED